MENQDNTEKVTLAKSWEAYKKGIGERPTVKVIAQLKERSGQPVLILTKEVEDRDGEIVVVEGIDYSHYANTGMPWIDAHRMNGSAIDDRIGTILNIRPQDAMDGMELIGESIFAPTAKGEAAKKLYEAGHPIFISIGFGVNEYDTATKKILSSELYEASAVNVPANRLAMVKGIDIDTVDFTETYKKLSHYEQIHPMFKEFTKSFMSDEFYRLVGAEKTGNGVLDINLLYTVLWDKLTNETTAKVETPHAEAKTLETPENTMLKQLIELRDSLREAAKKTQ